uniref:Reverse transcriptase domain-containing protein n=1 Tax=Tanacetum cinerariifolium TaxID=118510 RepID=A0A6L2K2M1_TANCI|nr:reverse transcriptase domain-containing protein [Tanacetum cinerariifolium]
MARIDAMTMKMDDQYKDFQSRSNQSNLRDDDLPMSREEEAKFMQTFCRTRFYNDYRDRDSNCDNWRSSGRNDYNRDNYQSHSNDKPDLQKQFSDFIKAQPDLGASINLMPYSLYAKLSLETLKPTKMSVRLVNQSFQYPVGIAKNMLIEVGKFTFPIDFIILEMEENSEVLHILRRPFLHNVDATIRVKQKQLNLIVGTERMIFHIDSTMKYFYLKDDTCFSIDVIDEILEEDFDALLDEGRKILHFIEGTILEEKLFVEFNEFMEMTADENSESESDTEEPPFKKITFNTDYKEKTTFTCPFGTYTYRRMPFGLCNALATFQRCMLATFHDMIEESVKVFMNDFSVFGSSFDHCLNNLDKMLQHSKDAHLVLNWERCHFMVKEGIMLGHKVSKAGLKVDKAKIDVISKLPPPTNIKENITADHLSRIENEETSDDSEVDDNFSGETLMEINTKDDPWFADFANYLASDIIPKGMTYQQKKKNSQTLNTTSGRNPTSLKYVLMNTQSSHKRLRNTFMQKDNGKKDIELTTDSLHHTTLKQVVKLKTRTELLKEFLKKTIKDNPTIWSRKLDDTLWAFHTAYKTPTGTTPYKLIYGRNSHLPFEIEQRAY